MTPKRHAIAKEIIKLLYPGPPSANSYTFSHLVVGADAHIGPLGSREFSRVPIKNQCILRADRSIRPKMRGIFRTLP